MSDTTDDMEAHSFQLWDDEDSTDEIEDKLDVIIGYLADIKLYTNNNRKDIYTHIEHLQMRIFKLSNALKQICKEEANAQRPGGGYYALKEDQK